MSPKQISRERFLRNAELQKKLLTYSTAASLAMAGVALAPAAVVADVDPDDAAAGAGFEVDAPAGQVPDNPQASPTTQTFYSTILPGSAFPIDFDGDADPEFLFSVYSAFGNYAARFMPEGGSDVGTDFIGIVPYAFVLSASTVVGPAATPWAGTASGTFGLGNVGSTGTGPWPAMGSRYLGLRFQLNGASPYYGWVRMSVGGHAQYITIEKHVYNPTLGAPIVTGYNPNAVTMAEAEASSGVPAGLLAAAAGALALLGGVLAWLRQRMARRIRQVEG